jgi:hypothetical protein
MEDDMVDDWDGRKTKRKDQHQQAKECLLEETAQLSRWLTGYQVVLSRYKPSRLSWPYISFWKGQPYRMCIVH